MHSILLRLPLSLTLPTFLERFSRDYGEFEDPPEDQSKREFILQQARWNQSLEAR